MFRALNRVSRGFMDAVVPSGWMYNSSASIPSTAPWADYWYMPFALPGDGGIVGGDEAHEYVSACFAATRLWCNVGSKIPLNRKKVELNDDGEELSHIMWDDPVHRLLNYAANDDQTAMVFRAMMVNWQINRGTAFAQIQRDHRTKVPAKLWPIHPNRCRPFRSENTGELWWHVRNNPSSETDIPDSDMLRIPYTILDHTGLLGVGIGNRSQGTIQIAQNMDRTEGDSTMSGVPRIAVEVEREMSMPEQDQFRRSWREIYTQAGETVAIFTKGMKAHPLGWSATDSDFANRRDRIIGEVGRWYDVPLTLLRMATKESAGNVEQLGQEFQTYSLTPLEIWEQECAKKLMSDEDRADRQKFELDYKALMKADHSGRANYYNSRFNVGSMTSNQIRQAEGENPYPDGNTYFVQGAMRPVTEPYNAKLPQEPKIDPKEGKSNPLKRPGAKQREVMRILLHDRFQKILRKECAAAVRASAKPNEWCAWIDSFYPHHEQLIIDEMQMPQEAGAKLKIKLDPKSVASQMVEQSRGAWLKAADGQANGFAERIKAIAESWERDRAKDITDSILKGIE